ncbi:MAG: alpha-galactosidase [Pirellulales bacterium]|nr:alpha-galactosidase [Pirellulales bacterium]
MKRKSRKKKSLPLSIVMMITASWVQLAVAVEPTADEMAHVRAWITERFDGSLPKGASEPFFSFIYDGKSSASLLQNWGVKRESRQLDKQRVEHTLVFADPKTGLIVRCVGIEYHDFPAVEWVLFFKNNGSKDTPILADVQALDMRLTRSTPGDFVVYHAKGCAGMFSDYAPLSDTLAPKGSLAIYSHGIPSGLPSQESLPMFNVERGGQGTIVAIGWTGPWKADFSRNEQNALQMRAGMDRTHLVLHPGEEIRSPRVLTMYWKGDRNRGHNLWRRLLFAHYSPRPGGKPFAGLICDANWGSWMSDRGHIAEINAWGDRGIPMECYWMDAGWTDMSRGWAAHQSQQTPNKTLFPDGLRPVSDAAHRRGMKFLLWFVPQSLFPGVGIAAEHSQWLGEPFSCKEYGTQVFYSLDHGDTEVNQFMIDRFSKIIGEYGIDVFRQDGTSIWPKDPGSDRVGISQIRFTTGFYAFWDGLLKKHPHLLIDNCACGGRKLDLETISRSIALWRSDSQAAGNFNTISNQAFNQGLFPWIPLSAGVVPVGGPIDAYKFRSAYCPAMVLHWNMGKVADPNKQRWSQVDVELMRRMLKEYVAVRPYTFGDYYPLVPYSLDPKVWTAWQFDRTDLCQGMVQAFRRADCPFEKARLKLQSLDPGAVYTLTNLDVAGTTEMRGRELMDKGISITINNQPGSAVIVYKKKTDTMAKQ